MNFYSEFDIFFLEKSASKNEDSVKNINAKVETAEEKVVKTAKTEIQNNFHFHASPINNNFYREGTSLTLKNYRNKLF